MKKTLLFLLLLFSTLANSQTIRKVNYINGLPATGIIIYNDSSEINSLQPWTLKIDIRTLDGTIDIKTEYTFGTEEVINDKMLSSFFYKYNDDGNITKKLNIKTENAVNNKIDNIKWDSAIFTEYNKNIISYNIKF